MTHYAKEIRFKNFFDSKERKKHWFITGGAGFIGSHFVDLLVSAGCQASVYDNLCSSTLAHIGPYIKEKKIKFYRHDLLDLKSLTSAMAGHDVVVHLGANTNIPIGFSDHRIDLDNDVVATHHVLEGMLKNNIKELLFASTGAVYGESIKGKLSETSGPLIPLSLYGAGKLSSEAFISAYCSLFGIKAWIFRFGNVIGDRINHGIIYDFITKLKKNSIRLEILGTGQGRKNYFLVEECIHGMLFTHKILAKGPFPILVNLGTNSTTKIMKIAEVVTAEMGFSKVQFAFTGTKRGWPGDQPVVLLDTTKINRLGWYAQKTSTEAVRTAVRRLLGKEEFIFTFNSPR